MRESSITENVQAGPLDTKIETNAKGPARKLSV